MMTALAMADGPGPVRKAIRTEMKAFGTVGLMCARTADGSWVLYNPIPDVIGEQAALTSLYHKRVSIRVEVSGREVTMEFVSRADFLGTAIISERHPDFRAFVVKLLEILEDTGVAPAEMVAADVADDPDVQKSEAIHRATIKAARAKREASEAKQLAIEANQGVAKLEKRTDHVEQVAMTADQKAEEARRLAKATQGEANAFPLVKWALTHGIVLDPEGDGRDEGTLLATEMRKVGLVPRKVRTTSYPAGVNIYPEDWLLRWKRHYVTRHPELQAKLKTS
jgi:hypothetical protein